MLKIDTLRLLLGAMIKHDKPLSYIELHKELKLSCAPSKVQYWLKICEQDGLILKEGNKYRISNDLIIKDGLIICMGNEMMTIFGCPHYGVDCDCTALHGDSGEIDVNKCALIKEKMDLFKMLIDPPPKAKKGTGKETLKN